MTNTYTTNGNYTYLKQDEEGIMTLTILHNKQGLIYNHCDGMTDKDTKDLFNYYTLENEEELYYKHLQATLSNDTLVAMEEMQEEYQSLGHFEGVTLFRNTYIVGSFPEEDFCFISGNVITARFKEIEDAYNYALNHRLKGSIATYFNRNYK